MKVTINSYHAIALWKWNLTPPNKIKSKNETEDSESEEEEEDLCGICRVGFDGCCPDCKTPGDGCPLSEFQIFTKFVPRIGRVKAMKYQGNEE